jgi:hypothetical protein
MHEKTIPNIQLSTKPNYSYMYVLDKMCSYSNLIYTETSTDTRLEMSDIKASDGCSGSLYYIACLYAQQTRR